MEQLYSAADLIEAEALTAYLNENGIRARVIGDLLGAAAGGLPPTSTGAAVHVESGQLTAARALLSAWQPQAYSKVCRQCGYDLRGLPTPRCPECGTPFAQIPPAWDCAACGEQIEGQFSSCWNCGAEREASADGR